MKSTFKIDVIKNKSLTYMLPLIHAEVNFDFLQFLVNSYVSFNDEDETYCVMYKWNSSQEFLKYEGRLMNHPLYIGHADFGETVVYKFQLTLQMKKARALFLEGNYKSFSNAHKAHIFSYIKLRGYNNGTRIAKILDKDDALVSPKPELKNEVVKNHIKELTTKNDNNPWK
tara:strand:+ start:2127 stop:2639 length:513 start_codon:yes stop_codon:yes gene_type:complete